MASEAAVLRQWIKRQEQMATPGPVHEETPGQITIQEGIRRLAAGLTDPDDERRQIVVKHVLNHCIPAVQSLIIGRLVEILKENGPDAGPAVASLAQFGKRALAALNNELVESRSGSVQLRLVSALTTVAQKLPISECVDLMWDLMIAYRLAVDDEVGAAIAKLLANLRRRR